jgi:hypothetical protein
MAKSTVEVLVDDLDGLEAAGSVQLGWNGEWRELELSEKNLAALSKALDKYWSVGRAVSTSAAPKRRGRARGASTASNGNGSRDPKAIRVWAEENGIPVPSRGRIPGHLEEQYNQATGRA